MRRPGPRYRKRSEISDFKFEISNRFSGGCVERATPVPIPNTEVKPLGADGTAWATAWESRKPPGLLMKARERNLAGFLIDAFIRSGLSSLHAKSNSQHRRSQGS